MNIFAAPNCHPGKMIFNETELTDKREALISQLQHTREIVVRTYNNLSSLSENPFLKDDVYVNDMPLATLLPFLERTVDEFSSSLYEEMAFVSNDIVWLKEFTDYLHQSADNIKKIDVQSRMFQNTLFL